MERHVLAGFLSVFSTLTIAQTDPEKHIDNSAVEERPQTPNTQKPLADQAPT
jgi:hypothetical protein